MKYIDFINEQKNLDEEILNIFDLSKISMIFNFFVYPKDIFFIDEKKNIVFDIEIDGDIGNRKMYIVDDLFREMRQLFHYNKKDFNDISEFNDFVIDIMVKKLGINFNHIDYLDESWCRDIIKKILE